MNIYGNSLDILKKSLDYTWAKKTVITDNIANYDTPGYKAKYITFEDRLKNNIDSLKSKPFIKRSDIQNEIDKTKIEIHKSNNQSLRADGNNVDMEAENIELSRTQLQYQALTKQINDQFTRLRTVIDGR